MDPGPPCGVPCRGYGAPGRCGLGKWKAGWPCEIILRLDVKMIDSVFLTAYFAPCQIIHHVIGLELQLLQKETDKRVVCEVRECTEKNTAEEFFQFGCSV